MTYETGCLQSYLKQHKKFPDLDVIINYIEVENRKLVC